MADDDGGGAYEPQLETTGDAAADSDAVRRLCESKPAQNLSIGGAGLGLSFNFLDADTTKSCLVALSSSIRSQAGSMEAMRGDVHAAMVASGAGGKDHLELEGLRERLRELEGALTNLAQNVQGFTEEQPEEEPLVEEVEAPPPEPLESEEEKAARLAAAADRRAAAAAAADARLLLEEEEAKRRAAEIEALEAKYESERLAAEEKHKTMRAARAGKRRRPSRPFPLVSADSWTSDHLSERSRRVDAFYGTRARGTLTLKRR